MVKSGKYTDAEIKARVKYDKKTYDPMTIKPKKSEAEIIRQYVESRGESLTRFLVRAATAQMEHDKLTLVELLKVESDSAQEIIGKSNRIELMQGGQLDV